jgi:hypothetical protein
MEARLTPRVVAIAATVYCPDTSIHLLRHLDLMGGHDRGPATVAAPGPNGSQPGGGAFADEVAFECGQGGKDVEDELAAGVVVSIASWRLRKPTPHSARPVMVSTRWRRERPRRSSFQTTRVSPGAQLVQDRVRVGRSARAPLAVSTKTR